MSSHLLTSIYPTALAHEGWNPGPLTLDMYMKLPRRWSPVVSYCPTRHVPITFKEELALCHSFHRRPPLWEKTLTNQFDSTQQEVGCETTSLQTQQIPFDRQNKRESVLFVKS